MLDDLGERLARHIGAREQPITGRGPGGGAAGQDMDVAVTEAFEAPGGPGRHTVRVIEENHPTGASRNQPGDITFEPAVWKIDSEERVTRPMLPFLSHIQKGDLAAIGKPASDRLDIDEFGHMEPSTIRHRRQDLSPPPQWQQQRSFCLGWAKRPWPWFR